MLNPDFKNGKKLDLHNAFALFAVAMGLLFFIDAAPGNQAAVSMLTVIFGLAWFVGHKEYKHWQLAHPHDRDFHRPHQPH